MTLDFHANESIGFYNQNFRIFDAVIKTFKEVRIFENNNKYYYYDMGLLRDTISNEAMFTRTNMLNNKSGLIAILTSPST